MLLGVIKNVTEVHNCFCNSLAAEGVLLCRSLAAELEGDYFGISYAHRNLSKYVGIKQKEMEVIRHQDEMIVNILFIYILLKMGWCFHLPIKKM